MRHPSNNRRVVISDSKPDFEIDSDASTADSSATTRSRSHLSASQKPEPVDASDQSNEGDAHGKSGKLDKKTYGSTSNMRDPTYRNANIRSDYPSNQIRGSTMVKRKIGVVGLDPHSMTPPLPQASNESNQLQADRERPGKRQRLARGDGQKIISYDSKLHPMDDVLRPKYSAKRRGIRKEMSEESSDGNGEIQKFNEDNFPGIAPNSARRRSSRNTHQSEKPIYSAKWHPLDQMLRENAPSLTVSRKDEWSKRIRKDSTESSSTPKDQEHPRAVDSEFALNEDAEVTSSLSRRRSARVSSSRNAPPNYDMKYHVMDSTLRPKAAAKRIYSKIPAATSSESRSKSMSSTITHDRQLPEPSPTSLLGRLVHHEPNLVGLRVPLSPSKSQLQNPYLNRHSLDWAEIQEMDRCVYLLQRGAPLYGSTLPQDWTHHVIKKILRKGLDSHNELSLRDRIESLKSRYESVRLGLQIFFGSAPEPISDNDWTLSKTEGFDVYNMIPGSKYWRHQEDSEVAGTKAISGSYIKKSAKDITKYLTEHRNQDGLLIRLKPQNRNKERTPTGLQNITKGGNPLDNSNSKQLSVSKIDTERSVNDNDIDNVEKGVITETEENLVESMRAEYVAASVMSEAALEELLAPAEQYLRNESNPEATPDLYLSDSRGCESAEAASAHSVKALGEINFVAPEAKPIDLYPSSNRGLDEGIQINKKQTTPNPPVSHCGRYDERQNRKEEKVKAKKRRPRDFAVTVHQDLPGRTPLIERIVRMNPASPGTDIPKENLESNGSVEYSDRLRTRGQHGLIGPRRSASVFDGSFGSSSSGSSRTLT